MRTISAVALLVISFVLVPQIHAGSPNFIGVSSATNSDPYQIVHLNESGAIKRSAKLPALGKLQLNIPFLLNLADTFTRFFSGKCVYER